QLRIPEDVGECNAVRLSRIETHFLYGSDNRRALGLVKLDPVVLTDPARAKIRQRQLTFLWGQWTLRPALDRLVHQRMVIRVVMAENETMPSVRRIPRHDPRAQRLADRRDDALRSIDAVMCNDDVRSDDIDQP